MRPSCLASGAGERARSEIEALERRIFLSAKRSTAAYTKVDAILSRIPALSHHPSVRLQKAATAGIQTQLASLPRIITSQAQASPAVQAITLGQQPGAPNTNQFHGDAARSGFNQNETVLNPANVAAHFGQVWQSPVLDGRVYATPLFADSIHVSGSGNAANHAGDGVQNPAFQNKTLGLVFAATGGGSVYAIAAQDTNGTSGIAPGTIVWKTHLGNSYGGIDGNAIGVLSTPIIDLKAGRIYVTASVTDYLSPVANPNHGGNNFEVFALNIADGSLVAGWPLIFTQALLDSLNQNHLQAPNVAVAFSSSGADQRGALNLSPDGSTLYVDWACYGASNPGWMTTVATGVSNGVANGQSPAIVSSYSSIDTTSTAANGGMWGAGGPAVDANGNVFVTTGDSPGGTGSQVGDFANSVVEFGPGQVLTLTGVYTPWNYPTQDTIDSDMGGGSPILITLPAGSSTTAELLATGGKQGNGYLLDAGNNLNNPVARPGSPAKYPADLTQRPPGTVTASQDPSLYDTSAAGIRSYFTPAQVGPLALFLPYNESSASGNTAKARDTPATFVGPDGSSYVIWAGSSKAGVGSSTPVAPSMYLTKVVTSPGQPAYLQIVGQNTAVMSNPGANMITGNGTANEIDWIVDAGVQRTDGLANFSNGAPVLYAYNALTMQPLWNSAYTELDMGGKYNSITAARGNLFVGTDRIQAFGLTTNTIIDDSVTGTGTNQFNYTGSGWQHLTGSATMGTFDGTVSTDSTNGDFATLNFAGSQIKVYANKSAGYGTATISVDGANTQTVSLTPTNSSPNGQGAGNVLVYTLSGLSAGSHTLKVLNNASSNTISIDRVEIVPLASTPAQLGVSMTDGNAIPQAAGLIPYTVNYQNAGSILNATGVGAAGVTLTETVPANSAFDAANSTSGWTLTSGNGSAGSTYTFTVGALNAGVTGSAVFSVDLNSVIPTGTTTITDTVTITDTAGDTATGNRTTPIPPPTETKLVFLQQPPANGGAGVPLSPAVTVAAQDQFGNTYTADSSSTVTLTLNGGTFNGGGNTATAIVSNGVATFNNLLVSAAGTYTLTATDGALSSATSSSFTVAANAKLAITQQPTQTTAGVAIQPAVTVAVEDQGGNVVSTDTSTVTLTISHGSFANGSTTMTAAAVNGVATFSNLVINATGNYTLVATDGVLIQAQTNPFNVVATASKLVFTQQPGNTYAGEAINPSVTVALEDSFGNIALADTSTVTLTLNGGTLFGGATTATSAAVNGIATFNNLVVTAPGSYTLTATDNSLASAVSSSFAIGTHSLMSIDDNNANNTGPIPQVVYSAPTSRWVQSPTALAGNFDGTLTADASGGDTATVNFTGTLITLYAAEGPGMGAAEVFIDGNSPAELNLSNSTSMIAPVFTSGLLTAGAHTIVVKVVSGNVAIDRFVVGPATPTISWATPVDLTYGTALDGTELDAFANVAGSFAYSPTAGTVLHAGQNQLLSATFTPTDSANYVTANAAVPINVVKSTPVITWVEPAAIIHGQALTSTQLDATANVPGTFVYNPPAGTVLPTGDNQPIGVTFTPDQSGDYNSVTAQTRIDVSPAAPVLTWPNPADIVDGAALSATQLNATANVPGTFQYAPAAGTVLSVGQNQALHVTFTPTDNVNYSVATASASINVVYGPAAKLAFLQQPTSTKSGVAINPAVKVAVEDSAGTTLPGDTSSITLTLSAGTFAGGGNTVTASAVNGVATFSNLTISTNGSYTLTAGESGLTSAISNSFNVGTSAYVNFNTEATDYTAQFAPNSAGTAGGSNFAWGAAAGVNDNGGAAGGGLMSTNGTDATAIYTPASFDLSDHAVHVVAEYVTAPAGLGTGDRVLQIGFITSPTAGFNGGFSFISARIYGDHAVEFQSGNGTGTAAQSLNKTAPTGTIATGDWLQLIFTTQETASGSFQGTFSLRDYGQGGVGIPTTVLAPVSYSVSGLSTIGTGSTVYAGFRTATSGNAGTALKFDNFSVDPSAAKLGFLQQPSSGTTGASLDPFVVAVQDINGNTVAGDSSTVTLTLSHGTFGSGATSVSAVAVNGIAVFNNLVINASGSYVLRATDTNPNLDPGFAPFVIYSTVVNRQIFYNNSVYDGNDPSANATTDNAAIAPDKSALLPGQAAAFANFTSYDKGINGIIIDVSNLGGRTLTAADFTFAVGNTTTPANWGGAPAPASVTVFAGAGINGSDRVELIWPDSSIRNEWLKVTMNANGNTGLAAADTFYFGNLVGKTNGSAMVNIGDVVGVKFHSGQPASISSPYDLNRDGMVSIGDVVSVKFNEGHVLAFPFTPPGT